MRTIQILFAFFCLAHSLTHLQFGGGGMGGIGMGGIGGMGGMEGMGVVGMSMGGGGMISIDTEENEMIENRYHSPPSKDTQIAATICFGIIGIGVILLSIMVIGIIIMTIREKCL